MNLNMESREFGGPLENETIPSEATPSTSSVERVTARPVTLKNNPTQERATPTTGDDIA